MPRYTKNQDGSTPDGDASSRVGDVVPKADKLADGRQALDGTVMPPKKRGGRPPVYDWEPVKLEIRAGQLSTNEIGRMFGVSGSSIRQKMGRARAQGDNSWEPDLQTTIIKQARERLAKVGGVASDSKELDMVEIAVQTRIKVVERHQKDLRKIRNVGEKLLTRLEEFLKDGTAKGPFKGDKESPADVLRKVSDAFRFAIPLERQAFGISEDAGSESARPDQGGIVYMPPKVPLVVEDDDAPMNADGSPGNSWTSADYDVMKAGVQGADDPTPGPIPIDNINDGAKADPRYETQDQTLGRRTRDDEYKEYDEDEDT